MSGVSVICCDDRLHEKRWFLNLYRNYPNDAGNIFTFYHAAKSRAAEECGILPKHAIYGLIPVSPTKAEEYAAILVESGQLVDDGDDLAIADWSELNWSLEQRDRHRESNRVRQQRWRDRTVTALRNGVTPPEQAARPPVTALRNALLTRSMPFHDHDHYDDHDQFRSSTAATPPPSAAATSASPGAGSSDAKTSTQPPPADPSTPWTGPKVLESFPEVNAWLETRAKLRPLPSVAEDSVNGVLPLAVADAEHALSQTRRYKPDLSDKGLAGYWLTVLRSATKTGSNCRGDAPPTPQLMDDELTPAELETISASKARITEALGGMQSEVSAPPMTASRIRGTGYSSAHYS